MNLLRNLFLTNRFFVACGGLVIIFLMVFVLDQGLLVPQVLFYLLLLQMLQTLREQDSRV